MKKLLLIIFICLFPSSVQASLLPFSFTGLSAERIDFYGEAPGWYVPSSIQETAYIGGSAGFNSFGYALQFNTVSSMQLKNVVSDIYVYDSYTATPSDDEYISFDYIVYSLSSSFNGGVVPDINSELARLSQTAYEGDHSDVKSSKFNLQLDPGTYWLALEDVQRDSYGRGAIDNFRFEGRYKGGNLATLTNPEPATFLLFSGGLLGAAFARRRKSS